MRRAGAKCERGEAALLRNVHAFLKFHSVKKVEIISSREGGSDAAPDQISSCGQNVNAP